MTFTPSAREGSASPFPGSEVAALKKLRLTLISEMAIAADQISRIDNRLHNLRIYEQVGRIGEESKATAEAAAESAKEAGEA